jgi:hypothetical protein
MSVAFNCLKCSMHLTICLFCERKLPYNHNTVYCRYTRSIGLCIIGATMWSFNELTWTWSTTAEVFSLNNLCIACLLYLMVQFESTDTHRKCKVTMVKFC